MASIFNITDIIRIIARWKIHLAIVITLSIVCAVIFSGPRFIHPKYKSGVILYPSNIIPYGNETPTEQTLQLLQAGDIRYQIITEFDLMKHYGIDPSEKYAHTALNNELEDNITFGKTEFESVQITVYDTDPKIAAAIANRIVDLFNLKARSLQREKSAEVVRITKNEMEKKKNQLDSIESALNELREKYGILDFGKQSQALTKEYYSALAAGRNQEVQKVITPALKKLQEKGGDFIILTGHLERVLKAYNKLRLEYEVAVRDIEKELTYSNIITRAYPSEKKSYPVRWLIVITVAISTAFLSLLILILIENTGLLTGSEKKDP